MTKRFPDWKKYLVGGIVGAIVVATIGFALSQTGVYNQGFLKFNPGQKFELAPRPKLTPGDFKLSPQVKFIPR